MSEFIKFLKDDIFNGKKSFLATFITSWMIWNWEVVLILFSDILVYGKIATIKDAMQESFILYFCNCKKLAVFLNDFIPVLIAICRYLVVDNINDGMKKLNEKLKNFLKINENIKTQNEALRLQLDDHTKYHSIMIKDLSDLFGFCQVKEDAKGTKSNSDYMGFYKKMNGVPGNIHNIIEEIINNAPKIPEKI